MFDKLFKTNSQESSATGEATVEAAQTSSPPKKSLYRRYHDAKTGRNTQISDADLLKYTGKTKAELDEWAKDRPGVAGNQLAGKINMGPTTGLGGLESSQGYGGWGPDSNAELKFPPKPQESSKKLDEDDD